jgi:nucleotidyltransferase substrate binding protein (TIGR01987 family)
MPDANFTELLGNAARRYSDAAALVEASLLRYRPFNPAQQYSPEQREPWDALCDRYLRAVEMAIRMFRTMERSQLALNSESFRDLLGNMAKWGIIVDEDLWFRMRDLRNRIAHDYLPHQLGEIYALIHDHYGPELLRVRDGLPRISGKTWPRR